MVVDKKIAENDQKTRKIWYENNCVNITYIGT
jgi:hypothetical protein